MYRVVHRLRSQQQRKDMPLEVLLANQIDEKEMMLEGSDDDDSLMEGGSSRCSMMNTSESSTEEVLDPLSDHQQQQHESSSCLSFPPTTTSSTSSCSPSKQQQQLSTSIFDPTLPAAAAGAGSCLPRKACHDYRNKPRTMGDYQLLGILGTGMTGRIRKAHHMINGTYAALKVLRKDLTSPYSMAQLETEVKALQLLDHPHIIKLKEIDYQALYPKKNGQRVPSIVMALELAERGDLMDYLISTGHFSEILTRTLFKQLLSAVQYCHSKGTFHRDIKPENLLLDQNFKLKLADFGLSTIQEDPNERRRCRCGTRSYMAPEVLYLEEYDAGKADVWSMGVVLMICLTGNPPFKLAAQGDWWYDALSQHDYARFWKYHETYGPQISPSGQALLNATFECNPEQRLSPEQIMSHEWMQGPCLSDEDLNNAMAERYLGMKW